MSIQALLFKIDEWTNTIKYKDLEMNNIKYRSYRIRSKYYRFRIQESNYNKYKYRIARNYIEKN